MVNITGPVNVRCNQTPIDLSPHQNHSLNSALRYGELQSPWGHTCPIFSAHRCLAPCSRLSSRLSGSLIPLTRPASMFRSPHVNVQIVLQQSNPRELGGLLIKPRLPPSAPYNYLTIPTVILPPQKCCFMRRPAVTGSCNKRHKGNISRCQATTLVCRAQQGCITQLTRS